VAKRRDARRRNVWTPADIGIARLREVVFRPFLWKLGSEDE
jgi:hypothetical protein